MDKEERELVITILTNYITAKDKILLSREEYRMLINVIEKLSLEED